MIDADFVRAIKDLAQRANALQVIEENGQEYVVPRDAEGYPGQPVPFGERVAPAPPVLNVHTLEGLVGYLRENRDQLDLSALALHVVSPTAVALYDRLHVLTGRRNELVSCSFLALIGTSTANGFAFGQFLDPEAFSIGLQALFVDAFDRPDVLRLAGNLREEGVRTVEDDGVSQAVTTRQGVALATTVVLPNPVTLAPFRTFREVDQPESRFVLRARGGGEGKLPTLALFECDGGAWRLTAIERVGVYLRTRLFALNIPVYA